MLLNLAKSKALLENICGKSTNVSIGSNGSCYLGLFTTAPSSSGTGGVEVSSSGNNYARVEIHSFLTATDRTIVNTSDINFNAAINPADPSAQSGADWGTIVAFGLFTGATGGSAYAWGLLDSSVTVNTQNTLHFLAGDFELTLDEA